MKRNEAIELLEKFSEYLIETQYVDYISIEARRCFLDTDWAKENLRIGVVTSQQGNIIDRLIRNESITPQEALVLAYDDLSMHTKV